MKFEFIPHTDFNFLARFAEAFNIPMLGNKLEIPSELGTGTLRKIDFDANFKLLLHHYTFKEEFVLKRNAPQKKNDTIAILFYNTALPNYALSNSERPHFNCSKTINAAVEISTSDLSSEIRFPAGTEINFTVVGIKSSALADLLGLESSNPILQTITNPDSTFLFYEYMSEEMQRILKQLPEINEQNPLSHFYIKLKIQELIYLLFNKLLTRENQKQQRISNAELDRLFVIRANLLADLSQPPQLPALAKMAGMSETKMKQLFRQVFGDSIYNYFQQARMDEAAFLLRQSGYTVSEVGYRLGFTNLSHFSRLFQKHFGNTPKKYTTAG